MNAGGGKSLKGKARGESVEVIHVCVVMDSRHRGVMHVHHMFGTG